MIKTFEDKIEASEFIEEDTFSNPNEFGKIYFYKNDTIKASNYYENDSGIKFFTNGSIAHKEFIEN